MGTGFCIGSWSPLSCYLTPCLLDPWPVAVVRPAIRCRPQTARPELWLHVLAPDLRFRRRSGRILCSTLKPSSPGLMNSYSSSCGGYSYSTVRPQSTAFDIGPKKMRLTQPLLALLSTELKSIQRITPKSKPPLPKRARGSLTGTPCHPLPPPPPLRLNAIGTPYFPDLESRKRPRLGQPDPSKTGEARPRAGRCSERECAGRDDTA